MEQIVAAELRNDTWLPEVGLSGRSTAPQPGEASVEVGHVITT